MTDFIEKLQSTLELSGDDTLKPNSILKELPGWDSVAVISVIVLFDIEYNKRITFQDIINCQSVSDLYALTQQESF